MAAKKSTKKEICKYVIATLREFSGKKKLKCSDGDLKLQKDLKLDKRSLKVLAMSLRRYIKSHNSKLTIKAKKISKKDFTVKNLKDLVTERILEKKGAKK